MSDEPQQTLQEWAAKRYAKPVEPPEPAEPYELSEDVQPMLDAWDTLD